MNSRLPFSVNVLRSMSGSSSPLRYYGFWSVLTRLIENVNCQTRGPGHHYAFLSFSVPYAKATDSEVLQLAFIRLLEEYAYPLDTTYMKVTLGYKMTVGTSYDVLCTLGKSVPLCDLYGTKLPKRWVYERIEGQVRLYSEKYEQAMVKGLFVNVSFESKVSSRRPPSTSPSLPRMIDHIIHTLSCESITDYPPEVPVKSLNRTPIRIPSSMTSIKRPSTQMLRPFIVADIETVLVEDVHRPYAAGYMLVHPGDNLTSHSISTFFSENYSSLLYPSFWVRSQSVLLKFLYNLEECVKLNVRLRTVYLHNFSRFDGIFLLRHYADRAHPYTIRPLMRNNRLYELKVYIKKKFLLRFRDSYTLIPGSLESLSRRLCPELGPKGLIPHTDLTVENLKSHSSSLIEYLRQDIRLLGGVMLKFQELNWDKYHIDIEGVMTVSALSMKIFRMCYFDPNRFHIHIPNRNQDTFIRRGYFGGHVDVYIPAGENLYHYDINSLYPFIMKSCAMPCGVPVWKNNLERVDLDSLFGFLEAFVVCPPTLSRPFLPYRDKFGTLIFPTGQFIGVFYSEELKFARELGYQIIPLRGYLFEKKESPFKSFIEDLYSSRMEAKKAGDEPMTFIYKILMNSLYGRLGMNPESTVTEICDEKKYRELLRKDGFQSADILNKEYIRVSYTTNSHFIDDEEWKAPKMSAVQLAAAITACARIHMFPHISRPDCLYTDTDSIVTGSPLPNDLVSSYEIGKFKLVCKALTGIFLSPKSYLLEIEDGDNIIKHKGPAKGLVTSEWFQKQLRDPSATEEIPIQANFRIDWTKLEIGRKEMLLRLGVPKSTKRENVYDSNDVWIGTEPRNIINLGTKNNN